MEAFRAVLSLLQKMATDVDCLTLESEQLHAWVAAESPSVQMLNKLNNIYENPTSTSIKE